MTVANLIEKLQSLPQNVPVLLRDQEGWHYDLGSHIEVKRVEEGAEVDEGGVECVCLSLSR